MDPMGNRMFCSTMGMVSWCPFSLNDASARCWIRRSINRPKRLKTGGYELHFKSRPPTVQSDQFGGVVVAPIENLTAKSGNQRKLKHDSTKVRNGPRFPAVSEEKRFRSVFFGGKF